MRGVLFLCTGNSCRSQMAEGFARRFLSPEIEVFSAGLSPVGMHPKTVQVMAELGVDISAQTSKLLLEVPQARYDHVVTVCARAAEQCPVLHGVRQERWAFDDPSVVQGSEAEVLAAFRRVRDEILMQVVEFAWTHRPAPALGVIGGSGFYELPGVSELRPVHVDTPFGAPSDALRVGKLAGKKVVFLARHGSGHTIQPTDVNARANIYALKRLGVTRVLSITAVGSLREEIAPGDLVVFNQFIDRTKYRESTFFGGGVVGHVTFADPICKRLAADLAGCARGEGKLHEGGTYVCIEGPQFSTRAESELFRAWGGTLVGMTNLPEARLAREAELCYASLALPTDYDCWRSAEDDVDVASIIATLRRSVDKARRVVAKLAERVSLDAPCACHHSLDPALLTDVSAISHSARVRLHAVLARRLRPAPGAA